MLTLLSDMSLLYNVTWTMAQHPFFNNAQRTYYVSDSGVISCIHESTTIRAVSPIHVNNSGQPNISAGDTCILVDEIVAYTMDNQYDRTQHYIFHLDQDNMNCSWSNLRVCHTVAQHQEALIQLLHNENPERRIVPVRNVNQHTYSMYLVSDLGEVFTLHRNKRLSAVEDQRGYQAVGLYADRAAGTHGSVSSLHIHRIVWSSFNDRIPQDRVIDHYNNKSHDNRLNNLRLATRSQNALYALNDIQSTQRESDILVGTRPAMVYPPINSSTIWRPIGILYSYAAERFGPFPQYEVSDNGRVRRTNDHSDVAMKILYGYHIVPLRLSQEQQRLAGGGVTTVYISAHVLVAHTFVQGHGIDGRTIVDHIDTNRSNNHYSNLRWATIQENNAYARGVPVRITAVGLNESTVVNSISALNQRGFFSHNVGRSNFVNGRFTEVGRWNNQEGVHLLCELINP